MGEAAARLANAEWAVLAVSWRMDADQRSERPNDQRGALHCQCSITHTLSITFGRGLWDSDSPESHDRSSKQSGNEHDNSGFAT